MIQNIAKTGDLKQILPNALHLDFVVLTISLNELWLINENNLELNALKKGANFFHRSLYQFIL